MGKSRKGSGQTAIVPKKNNSSSTRTPATLTPADPPQASSVTASDSSITTQTPAV